MQAIQDGAQAPSRSLGGRGRGRTARFSTLLSVTLQLLETLLRQLLQAQGHLLHQLAAHFAAQLGGFLA